MEETKETVEISAKTVEEALEIALRELDADRAAVAVEVISEGRAGFFGIGSEQARVRVTRLPAAGNVASQAMEVVNRLIAGMGISVLATISSSGGEETGPVIEVQGEDSGILIGKRGETLQAFQYIVNLALSGSVGQHPLVLVDVEKYRERRSRSLEALAARVAERVLASGRPITLEPMPASERRVIHMALAEHPSVTTQSAGDGNQRKITVMPRRPSH